MNKIDLLKIINEKIADLPMDDMIDELLVVLIKCMLRDKKILTSMTDLDSLIMRATFEYMEEKEVQE